ncbi:6974_t:CDS:1, partial [Scutellospora calospora]
IDIAMEKKISNLDNTKMKKKTNELKNLPSKLFESRKITFSISVSPIKILSLFILLISITLSWEKFRQQAICKVLLTNENDNKIQWTFSLPNYSNSESYLSLDN